MLSDKKGWTKKTKQKKNTKKVSKKKNYRKQLSPLTLYNLWVDNRV